MSTLTLFDVPTVEEKGAAFSPCRRYRFALWRIWDATKPLIMFVGLNPSIADAKTDDPTIRRVKGFAKSWGYGGVYMMNCFPYISTNPDHLHDFGNTSENDEWLMKIAAKCEKIVFAWGSFEIVKERALEMKRMFPNAQALIVNKDGSPRHPLYVKSDVTLVDY